MTFYAQVPVRTAAPTETPVTLAEAREHLRVDEFEEDGLISRLIDAATAHLDGWSGMLGRCLVTQTWRSDFSGFPTGDILRLPLAPLRSVTSVQYISGGSQSTLGSTVYRVASDAESPTIILNDTATWPTTDDRPDAVSVTADYGYGDRGDVPADIKSAMLLLISHWFDNRSSVNIGNITSEIPMSAGYLLSKYRRIGV